MSARLFSEDVTFLQRMLCSAGCYSGPANGIFSDDVDKGEWKLHDISAKLAAEHGVFDLRSERNIATLHPKAQVAARRFLTTVRDAGLDVRIISGTRTYSEQDGLFRIGRFGDKRPRVTNAKGGQSNHNFGFAWDIGIFEGGKYITAHAPYKKAALHCPQGVEWGGHWKKFPDTPHYQLALNRTLTDVRSCFEGGTPFIDA